MTIMNQNKIKFNFFLLKNIILSYLFSVIIISIIKPSPFILINCFIYSILSLPLFLFNISDIRNNKIINYFIYTGCNYIYLINFIKEIFSKESITRWENINGVSIKHTKTYYFYEINSGAINFELICLVTFLMIQLILWFFINKKIKTFNLDEL